jgi:hypothetical protein
MLSEIHEANVRHGELIIRTEYNLGLLRGPLSYRLWSSIPDFS